MKLFISWSGVTSKLIAADFRDWVPLHNKDVKPYMSSEDIEKGAHWSSHIRRELSETSFGLLILTPDNTRAPWLHFEAGAIVKSVEEGRAVPILFGLKQSEIQQPLSMFQAAEFTKTDMRKLLQAINAAAGDAAADEKNLDKLFGTFWPEFEGKIQGHLAQAPALASPPKSTTNSEKVLEEILVLSRQQMRILSKPEELIGREVLDLMTSLLHDLEGTAARLKEHERNSALALCARWQALAKRIKIEMSGTFQERGTDSFVQELNRFTRYVTEFQRTLKNN